MERITDKIKALPDGANYFSLEFFPPKTQMVCPLEIFVKEELLNRTRALPTSNRDWNACRRRYARSS
jgi:hypothetical protein